MSHDLEPTNDTHEDDLWLVKLPDGSVRSMTVDAMDDAFQNGELDASTAVQAPDGEGWTTLGAVAGLDETAPPAEVREAAAAVAAAEAELASSATASESERESRDSIEPPSSAMNSLAPMVASIAPPSSSFALSERPSAAPADLAKSLDVDLDAVEAQLRVEKRKRIFAFAAVAVGVVLAGVAVSYVSGGERPEAPKAAAAPQEVAPPPPAVDPATAAGKPSLSEEQKKRLSDADKARNAKKGAPPSGGAASPHRTSKEGNPFQNGGDKYDPLNGSL